MAEAGAPAIDLGVQLGVGAAFVLVMFTFHSTGLVAISRFLHLHDEDALPRRFGVRAIALMAGSGLLLFLLHFSEILAFAIFYRAVGAAGSFGESLYFSASAYATLGVTAGHVPQDWRLIGALEALIGFLLIGWSTAFVARNLRKMNA